MIVFMCPSKYIDRIHALKQLKIQFQLNIFKFNYNLSTGSSQIKLNKRI